jgi:hypothetical protein
MLAVILGMMAVDKVDWAYEVLQRLLFVRVYIEYGHLHTRDRKMGVCCHKRCYCLICAIPPCLPAS